MQQRHQHILSRLPKEWKIIFIQPSLIGAILLRSTTSRPPENVYLESIPVIHKLDKNGLFRAINDWIIILYTKTILRKYKITEPILLFYDPRFSPVIGKMDESLVWYELIDDRLGFTEVPRWIRSNIETLLQKASFVTASSEKLALMARERRAKASRNSNNDSGDVYLIGNGVDLQHFAPRDSVVPPPEEIAALPDHIIGYTGSVGEWFDFELVEKIAQTFPKISIVIIGFIFPKLLPKTKQLESNYGNIRFLGRRPYERLPEYLHHFSVLIIPFKIYDLTEAVNPTKFYEYCAARKPIITTALPEVRRYANSISYACSHEEFIASLEDIIEGKKIQNKEHLEMIARENSWDSKVEAIMSSLSKYQKGDKVVKVREKNRSPLVSIVIVNYNGRKYLQECLASLLNQTYQHFEIIMIDNKSADDSVQFVKDHFPIVSVIQNEKNLGFAGGNNVGIKASKGDLICLFNQDAIADKEWLSILVSVLGSSENVAAVAGKMFYWGDKYGKDAVFSTWSKIDPYTAGAYNFFKGDEPMSSVDYLSGAAMVVKREVIDKIGLLDPKYFLYFEETEWCARMIRASYDLLYVPYAKVWHVVSGSVSDSKIKSYYMNRSRIRFALKNFDLSFLPMFFSFFILESCFTFAMDLRRGNFDESTARARALKWNIVHLLQTVRSRRQAFRILRKSGKVLRSYNKSLPLKDFRIGRLEQYLKSIGK